MDYSFCLFALTVRRFLILYRALPKLVPKSPDKTEGLRELLSAATVVVVSQETEKGLIISPQEAGPEGTPWRWWGTGNPSPAAQVLLWALARRVGSQVSSHRGGCGSRG